MIDLKTLSKMEMALLVEARRQFYYWWPSDVSMSWVTPVALLAVFGERADAEALGVSPAGRTMLTNMLAHFNESADLAKAAIIPHGWHLVPCPPTERMLKACLATWRGPHARRQKSVLKRLQTWLSKRRHAGHGDPSTDNDARLQWLEEHRVEFTTNFLAMVEEAPPPPWARGRGRG